MAFWQIVLLIFVVLLPMSLLLDFWPHRERLDAQGRPLPRDWRPAPRKVEPTDEHH